MRLKEFLIKNKETLQLVYGILLIILIPLLVAFNTIFIINKYNKGIDATLQRQALSIGRSIYSLLKNDLDSLEKLQPKIKTLLAKNNDIEDISILIPENGNFKVIASSDEETAGESRQFYYYNIAWMQPDNDGLATDSLRLAITSGNEAGEVENAPKEDRFWLLAMPMSNAKGEKHSLLSVKLSSKIVDELTNYNKNASFFLLLLTVFIIILFLAAAVRLWDYAILYKKIREVDQMKDEFISMASHELRTPITAIRGYNSMILDGSFGEINNEVRESLEIVQSSSTRLADLIEDLLNVSRIEQGRLKLERALADPGKIIKDILKELKVQADAKKLELKYSSPAENSMLNIDIDRFKQVLINLIGNAIKYTEKGGVEIITSEKKKIFEIKIKDTGIGIAAEAKERLFEKFYRVRNEKTLNITGTGLGLWITKQLVELMDGKILVDSMENVGTQITLQFPSIKV